MTEYIAEDVLRFFEKAPRLLPLYQALEKRISAEFEDVRIKVQKTQITFANHRNFACVWQPALSARKKLRDRPDAYLVVTFGLLYRLDSPRIEAAVEPYPNRWTHHVVIEREEELDEELMGWIREAYALSAGKR